MLKKKIFWIHPQLRNYRMPLFEIMDKKYNITFYFLEWTENDKKYKHFKRCEKGYHYFFERFLGLNLKDIISIARGVKKNDIVISSSMGSPFSFIALIFSRLFRKKIIIWQEEFHLSNETIQNIKHIIYKIIHRFINSYYMMGIEQSMFLQSLGVKKEKIFISNEYPAIIYWNQKEKAIDILTSDLTLLYIGKFAEVKGIPNLLYALKILGNKYNIALNLVGYGPLLSKIMKMIQDIGLDKIQYLGKVFDDEKKAFLFKNVDALIVPSILLKTEKSLKTEGGPLVVLESLSAGTCVIGTTALGNVEQFIKNGVTGYIARQNDINDLADKIEQCFHDLRNGKITKNQVFNEFKKIPNHEFQADRFDDAIKYVFSK